MNFLKVIPVLVLLMPGISFATTQAPKVKTNRGFVHTMCDAEITTGVCDQGNGDIYAVVSGYESFTVTFDESAPAGSTCNVYALTAGEAGPNGSLLDSDLQGDGPAINSTSLSAANQAISFSGDFEVVWIECTITTNATVYLQGSEGKPRNSR